MSVKLLYVFFMPFNGSASCGALFSRQPTANPNLTHKTILQNRQGVAAAIMRMCVLTRALSLAALNHLIQVVC